MLSCLVGGAFRPQFGVLPPPQSQNLSSHQTLLATRYQSSTMVQVEDGQLSAQNNLYYEVVRPLMIFLNLIFLKWK